MFVIPAGMMFHAPVSTGKWLLWNQLPVTIGNIISGALLTGMALYLTYRTPAGADKKPIMMERQAPLSVAEEVGAASI
jgi:formate/nitrite transporter FocA (FNT family)